MRQGLFYFCIATAIPQFTFASDKLLNLHATDSILGIICLILFAVAYVLVMTEEITHLRKSKPVVLAAGVIWIIVSIMSQQVDAHVAMNATIRHNLLEYAELFLFLLVAMTYVNAMEERNVFEVLRAWLIQKGYNFRTLFWVTGILAFFISPIADNLTTALLMCAVVMAVGKDNPRFVSLSCINIVVASNAGGAFSPFGDITTLMIWQKGILHFGQFFSIFIPSVVNFVVPAAIMHFAIPKVHPKSSSETVELRYGAKRVIVLFLLTITTAVTFHNYLHLPPTIGMMTGLGYLLFMAYYIKISDLRLARKNKDAHVTLPFDIFNKIKRAEWDTLFFFYGVVLCVGGLATIGYLGLISDVMYNQWGSTLAAHHSATPANIAVGVLSAIVDNIPVMFAILTMSPDMSVGQWLLVTLTAGVGGSLLSVGSAAGVALMGQSKGLYTFISHLKWAWAIALGYAASIWVHILINGELFHIAVDMKNLTPH